MTSVINDGRCFGFTFARGPKGFEAFDAECRSLGLFDTEQAAVDAILKAPPASSEPLPSLEGDSA
jgi:hypothetical protein